jgi:aspartyl-tRNA synthetase
MTERTRCGEPRAADADTTVTVFGWVDRRRDHGGLIFLDVRDTTGVVQVVVNPQTAPDAHAAMHDVRLEYVVKCTGEVKPRGAENINPKLPTGEVEIHAGECAVLSKAKTPPFPVNEDADVDEKLRLTYRYLDLRRPLMQHNFRQRARFIHAIRNAMFEQDFVEIETPQMVRATPEGARDYLIPSRLFPGSFYALPQSPQLYKQLCMVAGFDRYFQIAHCMRDEDLRADRQPEFTQLDVEMSFVDEDDVFAAMEHALPQAWSEAEFIGALKAPFPRIPYQEAMTRFGVDKPDVRFGLELCDLTETVRNCGFRVFADVVAQGGVVKAICVKGGDDLSRTIIEGELLDIAKGNRARGLAYMWLRSEGWTGSIAKFFSEDELKAITAKSGAEVGDCLLAVADKPKTAHAALGALRNHLGKVRKLYDPSEMAMLWITEFPMFERDDDTGIISPSHHPFTQIHAEDVNKLASDPLAVRSRAYDIVMNGREIASGSIRITDPQLQSNVFAALGIDEAAARQKFGFLLDAFAYGAPPHGGIAPGIDRLVMEGLGTDNIRDVVAFPKNQQAQELMVLSPAPVDDQQLKELGIALRPGVKNPA